MSGILGGPKPNSPLHGQLPVQLHLAELPESLHRRIESPQITINFGIGTDSKISIPGPRLGSLTSMSAPQQLSHPVNTAIDARQVENSAGGMLYQLSDVERLKRFLILGSDSNTFYASAKVLILQPATALTGLDDNLAVSNSAKSRKLAVRFLH